MGRYQRYREWKQFGRLYTKFFHLQQARKAEKKIVTSRIPNLLYEKYGIVAVDPLSPDFPRPSEKQPIKINHPAWPRETPVEEHPLFKERPCFMFGGSSPMAEGHKQALVLAKAVPRTGLPQQLLEKVENVDVDSMKDTMHRLIMQSQAWDPTLEKLPNRRDPVLWWRKWPRYYGIPQIKKNEILIDNLFRFTSTLSGQYKGLKEIRYFKTGEINALAERNDELIRINVNPHLTISSQIALKAIENDADVSKTSEAFLPDIYPVKASIDLKKEQIYDDAQIYPLMWSDSPLVPRTVMLSQDVDHNYPWTPSQNLANAIMAAFGTALSYAKRKYASADFGGSSKVLPDPVVVQSIQICGGVFDFVVFQLNTLDLADDSGIKNIAWIDRENQFFTTPQFFEDFKEVKNYNPDVLKKCLALMLNGIVQ